MGKRLQITEYRIKSEYFNGNSRPVRVSLLADLHNKVYGKNNGRLLGAVDMTEPDFILCAGDMLVGRKNRSFDPAVSFMKALASRYPVYYANGNHESRLMENPSVYGDTYERYTRALTAAGVHILSNAHAIVPAGNTFVNVYGYELDAAYYQRFNQLELTKGQIDQALGEADRRRFTILIAHNPVYGKAYADWGADLTVSGHLHGGIVRLPLIGGVISPQMRLFPKYDGGLYEIHGKYLAVSRGLGEHTLKIRVMNPPELVSLRLEPSGDADGIRAGQRGKNRWNYR